MATWQYIFGHATYTLIGESGSGDNPDFEKLTAARHYIAAFRGQVIHEVTQIEDRISYHIKTCAEDSEVAVLFADAFLSNFADSFEKKKQLFKKLDAKLHFVGLSEDQYTKLDWLQKLRNDLAHGREFIHTSYEYAEIRSKNAIHRFPSDELKSRFESYVKELQNNL